MVPNTPRRSKILAVVSTAILAVFVPEVRADDFTLTAMSFNIRYGLADDGPDAWEHRKDLVVDVIRDYAPDIVGTQETLDFQAAYLGEYLPEYAHFGIGRDPENQGERMELYYRKDAMYPVETGHFWLSETPDVPGTRSWRTSLNRMVTWAKFYHNDSRAMFYVFNTHFDHRSPQAREESAKLLRQRIDAIDSDFPIIVLGDFNAVAASSEPYKNLVGGRVKDARLEAGERLGPEGTGSTFRPEERETIPRIDWILYSGPLAPTKFETIDQNVDGRYPSDHFPVMATFTWTVDEAMKARLRSGTR